MRKLLTTLVLAALAELTTEATAQTAAQIATKDAAYAEEFENRGLRDVALGQKQFADMADMEAVMYREGCTNTIALGLGDLDYDDGVDHYEWADAKRVAAVNERVLVGLTALADGQTLWDDAKFALACLEFSAAIDSFVASGEDYQAATYSFMNAKSSFYGARDHYMIGGGGTGGGGAGGFVSIQDVHTVNPPAIDAVPWATIRVIARKWRGELRPRHKDTFRRFGRQWYKEWRAGLAG